MVRVVPENMTREEVIDAARLLIYNSVELVEVIRYIQKQALFCLILPPGHGL
jgi:predicted RNA binding protein with dsRBD fold (UPF0201 family)